YLVRRYRTAFSAVSDTAHAYIIRGEEHIPMDLNPMLYDASYHSNTIVQANDILIIPFRQYFVTVSGAVKSPGRYPYIPDRDWSYYISLAGGFNTLQNSLEMVSITDVYGKKHGKKDPITPETVIEAKSNAFVFYFNQYAPVITTTLSIVSTVFTVIAVTR
ncbi:MAG TPA: ligand-binding protein, partial [Treponemataceae bacterium]|nr:ligand-binding protein [Treponemataceae bacterium]